MRNFYRQINLALFIFISMGGSLYWMNRHHFENYFTTIIMDDRGISQVRGITIPNIPYQLTQAIDLKKVRTHYRNFEEFPVCLSMWIGYTDTMNVNLIIDQTVFQMHVKSHADHQNFCSPNLNYDKFVMAKSASIEIKSTPKNGSSAGHITIGKNPDSSPAIINGEISEFVLPYKLTLTRSALSQEILAYIIVYFFSCLVLFVACRDALLAPRTQHPGPVSED